MLLLSTVANSTSLQQTSKYTLVMHYASKGTYLKLTVTESPTAPITLTSHGVSS